MTERSTRSKIMRTRVKRTKRPNIEELEGESSSVDLSSDDDVYGQRSAATADDTSQSGRSSDTVILLSDEEDVQILDTSNEQTEPIDLTLSAGPIPRPSRTSNNRRRPARRESDDDIFVSVSTSRREPTNLDDSDVIIIEKENLNKPDASQAPASTGYIDPDSHTPKRKLLSCPICLDHERTIRRTGRQLMSTSCGHIFCRDCIVQSLASMKCCPTCRKKLTAKTGIHPIFV